MSGNRTEGTDGSGKSTQMQLLIEALDRAQRPYKKLRFPRYGNPSCAPVEQYLAGAGALRRRDDPAVGEHVPTKRTAPSG